MPQLQKTDPQHAMKAIGMPMAHAWCERWSMPLQDMVAYPTDPTSLNNVLWAVKDHA